MDDLRGELRAIAADDNRFIVRSDQPENEGIAHAFAQISAMLHHFLKILGLPLVLPIDAVAVKQNSARVHLQCDLAGVAEQFVVNAQRAFVTGGFRNAGLYFSFLRVFNKNE